tara:strand:- start:6863 stop:7498 length:636 start_codon:yes stop_codon:yes gene_type:complete
MAFGLPTAKRGVAPPGSKNGQLETALETFGLPALAVLILAAFATLLLVGLGLVKLLRVQRLDRAAWKNCYRQDKSWSWRRARRELADVGNLYLGSVLLVAGASVLLVILVMGVRLVSDTDLLFSSHGFLSDEASGEVATMPGLMVWAICILVSYGLTARFQADAMTQYRRRLRKRCRQYVEVDEKRLQVAYLADADDDPEGGGRSPSPMTR